MGKYEDAILDFFKRQKDENKCDYIYKVAKQILDFRSMEIMLKDGRCFYYDSDEEVENA